MNEPGYSRGGALASSSRAATCGSRATLTAARFSSSCAAVRAPMITDVISGLASCQPSASAAGVTSSVAAQSRRPSTIDDRERALGEVVLVDRDLQLSQPGVGRLGIAPDLAGEHAGGQRAPGD